jgi:hypothetical protein
LLEQLVTAVMGLADPRIPGLNPPNRAVVARLILTLLLLPVAGLARTWDLRSYTGTLLAQVTDRERAYSQRYAERFLSGLAKAGAAECLTTVVARWTWSLWNQEPAGAEQGGTPAVFYIDGHRKAVYSAVLVPRGPVGKLGGKILGCRELVVLHDAEGHPLLAITHRGDYHLTLGLPCMLRQFEQAVDHLQMRRVVVDREGMAAELLAHLQQEGRQVVTLLRADQYEDERSFEQVGAWQPWRCNRQGQVICEVAAARFALQRPDPADPAVEVEVALIRDWRKLVPVEVIGAAEDDWSADLPEGQRAFWEEGWQATPAPPVQSGPRLIPVITTGKGTQAVELAQIYFQRWACQENSIRDWLIPVHLDTNHGYAKEPIENSELTKRQGVLEGRRQHLEHLAQRSRARLADLNEQDGQLEEQANTYTQRAMELAIQVRSFETAGRTEERDYLPVKAQHLAAAWEVRQRQAKREKMALRRQRLLDKCEGYCREQRQVLRQHEDLAAHARDMYALDHAKDQIMTLFKLGLANLGMQVRDQYFGASYQHCGWQRLLPFFKLGGWIRTTANEVQLEFCAFNNRALVRDLAEVCHRVNTQGATLPDGRRLVVAVGERLRVQSLNGPLAQTG